MKTTSALLMALAMTIAGACEKKKQSAAEPEKTPAAEPDKTAAPAPEAPAAEAKPDVPAPPPMIGTISAPELSAWAKTVTPGSKRVGRSKLPEPVIAALEKLVETVAPKVDYTSDDGPARLRWARVMTPSSIAISWGRKSDQSSTNEVVTNRFFGVAITDASGKAGMRTSVAMRVSNPQMVDDQSWSFDKDRDLDGDGHLDTLVSYDWSKSNFIDGTYKGLIALTSATGAAIQIETYEDEDTSNDGEGEAGSSIKEVATVNCLASIDGRPTWLIAFTAHETNANEEYKDNPEWTTYEQTALVVDANGHPRARPVYARIVETARSRGALVKKLEALAPPKVLAGPTRLADCGDGKKLALVVQTDAGWHLLHGFALDRASLSAKNVMTWGALPPKPKKAKAK